MTSGLVYKPGGYPSTTDLLRKQWNGTDGKYETFQGERRDKWNAYSMTYIRESIQLGQTSNVVSTTSGAVASWSTADEMRIQSKLVSHIKGHKFNLAVDLAQADQLVKMCAGTITHFGRALRDLKRGNIAGALRELGVKDHHMLTSKDVSGRWLELQYGWLPAIGSCYEAAKAFEQISENRKVKNAVVIKKEQAYEGSASPTVYTSPGTSWVRKKITYELYEELALSRRLGLMDPLSVLWEITPYSFVADWFLPIGDYLENLAILPSLKGRFMSTVTQETKAAFERVVSTNPGLIAAYKGSRRIGFQKTVTRTVSTSLTTQKPQFVNPIIALSGARIKNAVALFHQSLK
jgi:hypothetical protein